MLAPYLSISYVQAMYLTPTNWITFWLATSRNTSSNDIMFPCASQDMRSAKTLLFFWCCLGAPKCLRQKILGIGTFFFLKVRSENLLVCNQLFALAVCTCCRACQCAVAPVGRCRIFVKSQNSCQLVLSFRTRIMRKAHSFILL